MSIKKKDLETAIRRTYRDEAFWEVMVNGSRAESGPFDGGCLVCARALVEAFKEDGTELVRMVSPLNGGQTEHYGALIGKYICDFYGAFDSPDKWIANFTREESIRDRVMSFAQGFAAHDSIVDDPQTSAKVAAMLKEHLPENASILKAQARDFKQIVMGDPQVIVLRAQGLELDLMSTGDGLEISSLLVPPQKRGQGLASKFLKRVTELADAKSMVIVLEVGTDEAGIGLGDWYERHGFAWGDGCMERVPKKEVKRPSLMQ